VLFPASVHNGRLLPDDPGRWAGALAKHNAKRVTVELLSEKRQRTLKQQGLYRGYLLPALSEWTGYRPEEMHDILRGMFLSRDRTLPNGKSVRSIKSTADSDFSTIDMNEYYDRCMQWAAEQGVYIPDHDAPPEVSA
jgi:hypothetical protein